MFCRNFSIANWSVSTPLINDCRSEVMVGGFNPPQPPYFKHWEWSGAHFATTLHRSCTRLLEGILSSGPACQLHTKPMSKSCMTDCLFFAYWLHAWALQIMQQSRIPGMQTRAWKCVRGEQSCQPLLQCLSETQWLQKSVIKTIKALGTPPKTDQMSWNAC